MSSSWRRCGPEDGSVRVAAGCHAGRGGADGIPGQRQRAAHSRRTAGQVGSRYPLPTRPHRAGLHRTGTLHDPRRLRRQLGATVDSSRVYMLDRAGGGSMLAVPFGHTVDALAMVLGEFTELSTTTATASRRSATRHRADPCDDRRRPDRDYRNPGSGAVASVTSAATVPRHELPLEINGPTAISWSPPIRPSSR